LPVRAPPLYGSAMQDRIASYGLGLAALTAAIALRWLIDPLVGDLLPLVTLFGAVAIAIWAGGLGPAILVATVGYVACAYLFIQPRGDLGLDQVPNVVGLAAYLLTCGFVIAIGQALRRARTEADEQRRIVEITSRRTTEVVAQQLTVARLLAAIVESSDDAIISKSLDGTIRSWNAAAERLFGFAPEEAIGRHISLVIPPERIVEEDSIIASLRAGRRIEHFDTERRHRDGRLIPVSLTISPIHDDDGRVVGASKIVRDVTEQRRLADNLRVAAAELAESNQRKNEFLATLAHELRNPLAPLSNMLEVLRRDDSDRALRERARGVMDRQLRQLVRLVDDLLDINRISHSRFELRVGEHDLAPILLQAVEASHPLIEAAGQRLVLDLAGDSIWVRADPARLAQVFGNLLNNASRYSPAGATVTLSSRREGDGAVVRVRDTGIGISESKLEEIFGMFTQLDPSHARTQGGLGIGLTLARRLLEMHGGTIAAFSEGEGRGSEFVVRLPTIPAPTAAGEPAPGAATAPPRRRILVVDDNVDAAQSLAMLLEMSGNETRLVHDGGAVAEVTEAYRPEVVLLDIGLPTLDGFEVCRRLRARPDAASLTIIAMTGWGQDEDRRKSREAGFDGHLVKPVDFEQLERVMAERKARRTPVSR
jgi:PAS domain S-box-containing protein